MLPGVAFVLYLAIGSIAIFLFLLVCVRISVFFEDTCPTRFCLRRKQRKMRKTLIRQMLYPDEPDSPRPAPPSDDNITADIICQPYIYRDAYSTGLTGLNLMANLPLTIGYATDLNPSDAIITNSEQVRVAVRRILPQVLTPRMNQHHHATEISIEPNEEEEDSLPPDYLHVIKENGNVENVSLTNYKCYEPPPPSYYECLQQDSISCV